MKATSLFCSAIAIGALTTANAQETTTPVGYNTQTCYNGVFTLVGVTLHGATEANGAVVGITADTLTVADGIVDALSTGPYLIEITSGTAAGAVNLITSFDAAADSIVAENDLQAAGVAATDTFVIRPAATIGSVFGTGSNVLINKGDANTGDLIYIPAGGGAFDIYYHTTDSAFGAGAWSKVGGGGSGADTPILYADSLLVLNRSGANYDLVTSGEVKTTPTIFGLPDTFNYISTAYPTGATLNDSGLANSTGFKKGDANTGDLVYIPDSASPGAYRIFYHTTDSAFGAGSWNEIGGSGDGTTAITDGIIIRRRATDPYNASFAVPSSWSN